MDAAEYKHIVLGLIFLKYINEEQSYSVPESALWENLQANVNQLQIGNLIDKAMSAVEGENPQLQNVLPKGYAGNTIDPLNLKGLIELIGNIRLSTNSSEDGDVLGRVFEFFLGRFALAEGKNGGQFYTPRNVVDLLVELIKPFKGKVLDPCCGSGGMFVQSGKFLLQNQGNPEELTIYGQESNRTTWSLARMNMAIRGIEGSQILWNKEGSLLNDAHENLKADYIISNPPFNDNDWSGEFLQGDKRWAFGNPSLSNANFAWLQHYLFHLGPNGRAGIVMHGSAASNKSKPDSEIREKLLQSNLVEAVIALPTQLFYNTALPVHVWILNKNKQQKNVLMIDAYHFGNMLETTLRELTNDEIQNISKTFQNWKAELGFQNEKGFSYSASPAEIASKRFILAPNRYVSRKKIFNNQTNGNQKKINLNQFQVLTKELLTQSNLDRVSSNTLQELYDNQAQNSIDWNEMVVRETLEKIIPGNWGSETPKKNKIQVKVLRGTDLPNVGLFNLQKTPTRYVNKSRIESLRVKSLDIVIELSGGSKNQPTGRAALITEELLTYFEHPIICSNFCKILRIDQKKVNPIWFYFYWQNSYQAGLTTRYENQPSGIRNFQLEEFLDNELISIPPKSLQDKYSKYFIHLFEIRNKMSFTSAKLNAVISESFENLYSKIGE